METRSDNAPLMTCRYCILHEMGHCQKHSPLREGEPRYLRLANGTLLRLEFDCKECQMLIWEVSTEPACK